MRNREHNRLTLVLLSTLALVVAACSTWGPYTSTATDHFPGRFSGTKRFDYEVSVLHRGAHLRLNLSAGTGVSEWALKDPHGEIRWEGEIGSGDRMDETRAFDPIPGIWTLALTFDAASYVYEITWTAE